MDSVKGVCYPISNVCWFTLFGFVIFAFFSCARVSSPTGGAKDIFPPKVLKTSPDSLQRNVPVNTREVIIELDEWSVLKNPSNEVIITPTPGKMPQFFPSGMPAKKIKVKFSDDLKPNTTYTINFGESIQDNNENNPLSNYTLTFSTGPTIDSLKLSGKVVFALSNEVPKKARVALYPADSSFDWKKSRPLYLARVDSTGAYQMNYLFAQKYKAVAFSDENGNRIPDLEKEQVAIFPQALDLASISNVDFKLSQTQFPYKTRGIKKLPDGSLQINFQGNPGKIQVIPTDVSVKDLMVIHKKHADSATIWFRVEQADKKESFKELFFVVKHSDKSDTLRINYNLKEKDSLEIKPKAEDFIPNRPYRILANHPLVAVDAKKIRLRKNKEDIPFEVKLSADDPRMIELYFKSTPETRYSVEILPKFAKDIFHFSNSDSLQFQFQSRPQSYYGKLTLKIQNPPKTPFFVQLLDTRWNVLEERYGSSSSHEFNYLPPGEYMFRILVDENSNGKWDSVNVFENTLPETSYIYKEKVLLRSFWEVNETWVLPSG